MYTYPIFRWHVYPIDGSSTIHSAELFLDKNEAYSLNGLSSFWNNMSTTRRFNMSSNRDVI